MKPTLELFHQLKSSAQEEIMCREASDTSDAWQDLASPENILALIDIALPVLEQGGWISCSERVPSDDDYVHIWPVQDFGVDVHIGQYLKFHKKGPGWFVQTYGHDGIEWNPVSVTHWQPLPAPPQPSATPQIDNDGWIEWGGGTCAPVTGMVKVRWSDGSVDTGMADNWRWVHDRKGFNIVAYRVVENDGREG